MEEEDSEEKCMSLARNYKTVSERLKFRMYKHSDCIVIPKIAKK